MKGAQKYEPAIWERGVEGGGGVAFALSQFRGLDYLGTWNSRYSESVFLSEEVKTMLYLNGVKSFDVTESPNFWTIQSCSLSSSWPRFSERKYPFID